MKNSKWLSLLFITILLLGCSSQKIQTSQPTAIPPTQTTPFLDFDHPRLHEIAGDKPLVIDEIVRTPHRTSPEYVAVILETNNLIFQRQMLVFRIAESVSTLIYDTGPLVYVTFNVIGEHHPDWLYSSFSLKEIRGFFYYYGNNIALPILIGLGGNCYDCATMKLIGISDEGEATDITPITDFNPKGLVDINENLNFSIVATQYYEFSYGACDHVSSPFAFRLFKWQGLAYTDVSKNEKEFYDQKITELITKLQEFWNEPLHACWVMPILANIFFDYESSGRVEYGWEQIQALGDLSHWDIQNTPPEEIQTYHDVFDQLEQRKNKDLATSVP